MVIDALGDQKLFASLGATMQEYPPRRIDTQFARTADRGHYHCCTLIDTVHSVHPFRIGKADESVLCANAREFLCTAARSVKGKRVRGSDFGERRKQLTHCEQMLFDRVSEPAANRILE